MKNKRNNLFETNSSTMHSLTFAFGTEKTDLKKIIGSNILQFGVRTLEDIDNAYKNTKKNYAIDIDKTFSWQDRADIIFWKLLTTSCSSANLIITQEKIRKIFKKRGIEVKFLIEKNIKYIEENYKDYCYYEYGDDEVNKKLLDYKDDNFEDQIINFIFSPYILEYTFCDEGMSLETFNKLEKDFNELLSEFPEGATGFQERDR